MDGIGMLKCRDEVKSGGDGGLGSWDGVLRTFFNAFGDKKKRNHGLPIAAYGHGQRRVEVEAIKKMKPQITQIFFLFVFSHLPIFSTSYLPSFRVLCVLCG